MRNDLPESEKSCAWLTSPMRAGGILGRDDLLPTGFLLRHGYIELTHTFPGPCHAEWANCFAAGGCQFYLAASDPLRGQFDLDRAFYMVGMCHSAIVVGPRLFAALGAECDLERGYIVPLPAASVHAFDWPYAVPRTEAEDQALYTQVQDAMAPGEAPHTGELLRLLCAKHPASVELPLMHAILPPLLLQHTGVTVEHRGDGTEIRVGTHARIRTRNGEIQATPNVLRSNPLLNFNGFLLPQGVATEFATDRECDETTIDCMLDVQVRW